MTDLLERATKVEAPPVVKEAPPRREVPPREPSRMVRWMGWLIGLVLVLGIGGLVWWTMSPEPVAPSIEAIDPHESPEVLDVLRFTPVAPPIESIDPHESPEILGVMRMEPVAPPIESIDPHESPEILRLP